MKFQGELGLGFLNGAVGRRAALLADVGDLDHASIEEGPWLGLGLPGCIYFLHPGQSTIAVRCDRPNIRRNMIERAPRRNRRARIDLEMGIQLRTVPKIA